MKGKNVFVVLLLLIAFAANAQERINCISLAQGAKLLSLPPSQRLLSTTTAIINPWTAEALQDDNSMNGWCSKKGSRGPFVFVFELSEDYLLDEVFFGNEAERTPGICTQEVKVEYSITSASQGYLELGRWKLKEYEQQKFKVSAVKARWVRLTVLSNYGNTDYTELMEFGIYSYFDQYDIEPIAMEGTWNSNWDWVSINKNEKGYLYGCYKYNNGRLDVGKVDRRVFEFAWDETPRGSTGWASLIINKEGNVLRGIWGFGNNRDQFGIWEFTYKNSTQYACPNAQLVSNKIPVNYFIPVKKQEPVTPTSMRFVLTVLDASTGSPVEAEVKVFRKSEKNPIQETSTDLRGKASFSVPLHQTILIDITKDGYMNAEQEMNIDNFKGVEATYTMKIKPVKVGEFMVLKNVLFKQGTAIMLDSSHAALDKLVTMLEKNPTMVIELGGHTDNQGKQELNIKLSEDRVNAVKEYLIKKKIDGKRIEGKGYGGSKPLYDNSTEATRRLNRRVEFKILKT